jgi:RNA polymerase sigma-70 factor (ECF subfamily)
MLFPLVGCYQTSEDLSQEAYIRVTDAIKQHPIQSPRAFLFQTARNLALDHLRKEKVRNLYLDRNADEIEIQVVVSPTLNPEGELLVAQQVDLLLKVLAQQPQRRREMLILHKVHGWHYPEIAQHYGLSLSAVEKNVRIALAHCLAAAAGFDLEQ